MPQRKTRLSNPDPSGRPSAAAELEAQLFGLGQFRLQLDGYRLTAPARLCKQLGDYCVQPFIFSPWKHAHLRIVPRALWSSYLDIIRAAARDYAATEDLVSRLNQTLVMKRLDEHRRWDVPVTLATDSGLVSTKKTVLLFPNRFWLELLSAEAWESFMAQTQQQAHSVDCCKPDYAI